jgi:hypothetical protein
MTQLVVTTDGPPPASALFVSPVAGSLFGLPVEERKSANPVTKQLSGCGLPAR